MDKSDRNIKIILTVFLIFFLALITYLSYFILINGDKLSKNTENRRILAEKNKILRGNFYDINGVELTTSEKNDSISQKRNYLLGSYFTHVLGYSNLTYGNTGLEKAFDEYLSGEKRFKIFDDILKEENQTSAGNNIKITIDSRYQKIAYDALGGEVGSVVMINPKTGEILAMASTPSFDPNNLEDNWEAINADANHPLVNRSLNGLYPPGSSFKIVTVTSAIDNMEDVTNRVFNDQGSIYFDETYSLPNFNWQAYGNINLKQAFVYSSNVVFGTLAMELGNDKLKETSEKFNFNKELDFQGLDVTNSIFPVLDGSEVGNIAQSGIGQGSVLATPLEMALVAGTIANNGIMMKPYIVSEIMDSDNKTQKKYTPEPLGIVTSAQNAEVIKDYMRMAVKQGTAQGANIYGVNVCGKTGTAEHNDENGNKLPPHSWFVGFAPDDNPQIAIAVIIENGGTGGEMAAPIAGNILNQVLSLNAN